MDKKVSSANKNASAGKAAQDAATFGFNSLSLNAGSSKAGGVKTNKGSNTKNTSSSSSGGSKGGSKKATSAPVLLGLPDTPMERKDDTDPYVTKIGGIPLWLDQDLAAPTRYGLCDCCKQSMYLLLQAYVPLEKSPYDRVVYVWACNQRLCMRKKGSFKVVRALKLNKEFARKLEKKAKPAAPVATAPLAANPFGAPGAFDMGSALFGGGSSGFGNPFAAPPGGVGSTNPFAPPPGFGSTSQAPPISFASVTSTNIPEKETAPTEDATDEDESDDSRIWPETISGFSPYYLYHAEEVLEDALDDEIKRKYGHLLAMDEGNDSDDQGLDVEDESQAGGSKGGKGGAGSATWGGETYEKQALPKGVDKAFQKFTERVQLWPEQCVRYDFLPGTPMLFTYADSTAQMLLPPNTRQHSKHTKPSAHRIPRCKACGGPRGFDFQLMPNLLSLLNVTKPEYLSEEEKKASRERKGAQAFDIGMEWGTILVYSCVADCFGKATATTIEGDKENDKSGSRVKYFEEVALAQFED